MDIAGNKENGMVLSGTGDDMNNSGTPVEGQDDQANEVDRIDKFARSEIFVQRLYHVCYMAEAAQRVGYYGSAPTFVPLCKELSVDEEPEIRQALAEQLPQLARIFTTEGTEVALQDVAVLLQIANTLLTDECEEVQLAAEQAFSEMAHVVRTVGGAIESDMLGIVLKLAASKEEAQRVCAANLLTGFAEGLERGPFEERAVPRIIELAEDQEFRVRKAVALGLPRCCKALSSSPSSVDELLLPVYVALSQDSVWAVRMACAEGIVRIAEVVTAEARARHLASTIERLARDASTWVRDSALQMLGPLLAMLHGTQELSQRLVALFTSMAEPFPGDNRLRLYCAFNFPAVVKSLGPERWPELQGAYRTLLCSDQAAVRKTLGYSLHELAQVLGEEVTKEHLLPAFQAFMADIDEVCVGVAKNLVPFIRTLPRESRLQCVRLLPTMVWVVGTPPALKTPTPPPPAPADFQVPRLGEAESPGSEADPEAPAHPPQDLDEAVSESKTRKSSGGGSGDGNVEAGREEGGAEEPPPSMSVQEAADEKVPGGGSEAGLLEDSSWRFSGRGEEGQEGGQEGGVYVDSRGRIRRPARVVRCKSFWHLRRLVVEQLEGIASLLDLSDVNHILLPFALELCKDPIASVRAEAAKQAGLLVLQLEKLGEEATMTVAIAKIRELAQSPSFRDRQMFVVTSSELIQGLASPALVDELLAPLLTICEDSVVNVRVRAARALAEAGKLPGFLIRYPAIQTSLEVLVTDRDNDVAFFAKQALEGRENEIETVVSPMELVPASTGVDHSESREGEEVEDEVHSISDQITWEVEKLSVEG